MKRAVHVLGVAGFAILVALVVHEGYDDIAALFATAGLAILWTVPARFLPYWLYAIGWRELLRPRDPSGRASIAYLTWVATLRDSVDRLLPVASIGGAVVGARVIAWRGIELPAAAASVIVETLLTLVNLYVFAAIGLALLWELSDARVQTLAIGFFVALPVPPVTWFLLRRVQLFDHEVIALLDRKRVLLIAGAWQLAGFISGALETWLALRLFGHAVGALEAIAIESAFQAVRHFAFFIPAGLGAQEAGLIATGTWFGVPADVALSLSLAKRMRELIIGLPALIGWQWIEAKRSKSV